MGFKKTVLRREVLLVALLLASTLVVAAIAAVYYSLTMQPDVSITPATVVFAQGTDWPSTSVLGTNSTWVRLALKAYPNATLVYEEPLNVSNTDGANSHQFRLRHISITPSTGNPQVSNFTFIRFVIRNATGALQTSFNYTTTDDSWNTPSTTSYLTLPANTQWAIYVETKATAGANGNIVANLQIAIDVQE